MSYLNFDIENKGKNYLDEKELLILYSLMKKGVVSTPMDIFIPNPEQMHVPPHLSPEELEKYVQKEIETRSKFGLNRRTNMIFSYLLELGEILDKEQYKISCNADYSLVEGGFLTDAHHKEMHEYRGASKTERQKNTVLSEKQKNFLDAHTSKEINDDISLSVEFTQLSHPPIEAYKDAILDENAEPDFIKLVNKLIIDYDGGDWDKNDLAKFLKIFFEHNRKRGIGRDMFNDDNQTELAKEIFEHTDIWLFIKDKDVIEKYLEGYFKMYFKDNLSQKSRTGLTGHFFDRSGVSSRNDRFYGFKKQKEVLREYIQNEYDKLSRSDLEIRSPYVEPKYIGEITENGMKLNSVSEEESLFLFVHTMIALELEGFLVIKEWNYGTRGLFDLYHHGFLFEVELLEESEDDIKKETKEISFSTNKPYLITDKGRGFIKLHKNTPKIPLGTIKGRKYKLMKVLMEPEDAINAPKKIEKIFEQIRIDKDNQNQLLESHGTQPSEQLKIVKYTIKEVQKIKGLQGKVDFDFSPNKKTLRIVFR